MPLGQPAQSPVVVRTAGEVTILEVSGRITLGVPSDALHEAVSHAIEAGCRKLLLNLEHIEYLDSSGVGELISAFRRMATAQGALKLAHVGKRVEGLLKLTGVFVFFDVQPSEAAALRSFAETG